MVEYGGHAQNTAATSSFSCPDAYRLLLLQLKSYSTLLEQPQGIYLFCHYGNSGLEIIKSLLKSRKILMTFSKYFRPYNGLNFPSAHFPYISFSRRFRRDWMCLKSCIPSQYCIFGCRLLSGCDWPFTKLPLDSHYQRGSKIIARQSRAQRSDRGRYRR